MLFNVEYITQHRTINQPANRQRRNTHFRERPNLAWSNPMPWKVTAELILLSPFVLLWAAFTVAETARVVAAARRGQK
jgi:hypothetical protein